MAAQVFPNTVFVDGFPGSASRHDLMVRFGGPERHIEDVSFTSVAGEPKKAFIRYQHYSSVRHALGLNGTRFYRNSPDELIVKVVDDKMLCHFVPGETRDMWEALINLKAVLSHVLDSRNQAQSNLDALKTENQKLTHCLNLSQNRNNVLKAEQDAFVQKKTSEEKASAPEHLRTVKDVILQVEDNKQTSKAHLSESKSIRSDNAGYDSRKRERDETEEPLAKRRLIYRDQIVQTCAVSSRSGSANDLIKCWDGKEEAEALLREAHAELNKAMVIDSLLAAFLRMDRFAKQVVQEINTQGTEHHVSVQRH